LGPGCNRRRGCKPGLGRHRRLSAGGPRCGRGGVRLWVRFQGCGHRSIIGAGYWYVGGQVVARARLEQAQVETGSGSGQGNRTTSSASTGGCCRGQVRSTGNWSISQARVPGCSRPGQGQARFQGTDDHQPGQQQARGWRTA
jgi:hypothetical protein